MRAYRYQKVKIRQGYYAIMQLNTHLTQKKDVFRSFPLFSGLTHLTQNHLKPLNTLNTKGLEGGLLRRIGRRNQSRLDNTFFSNFQGVPCPNYKGMPGHQARGVL